MNVRLKKPLEALTESLTVCKTLPVSKSGVALTITVPGGVWDASVREQDSQLKGKSLRRSMVNRAVKHRDGDETLPSAPEQTYCREYSEQCQHIQTCSGNVFAVPLVQEPTGGGISAAGP